MSGICGFVGPGDVAWLSLALETIAYRGSQSVTAAGPGFGLGLRFSPPAPGSDSDGNEPGILRGADGVTTAFAGGLTGVARGAAEHFDAAYRRGGARGIAGLDGAFAAARFDAGRQELALVRDPFGVEPLFYVEHAGAVWFASELKQLLAVPALPVDLDANALHQYLTFSFVPGASTPIQGVRRLLPGHVLEVRRAELQLPRRLEPRPWFELREAVDPALSEAKVAAREVRQLGQRAVAERARGASLHGVYLSGGIDSAAVAAFLARSGARVQALSLDFGHASVERAQAEQVAGHLGIPLAWVPARPGDVVPILEDLVWKLDMPFGDAVTAPQYLLGKAAREAGLSVVFNGEGGDQFFGGWTSKPMLAAAVYAGMFGDETPEEQYLRSYHRFYGLEDQLYTPELRERVGGPGQRRALLAPYLSGDATHSFLNRVRLADVALKGSHNILPRAEQIASGLGLELRMPLFDRALAELSFRIPPELKLHGACEKYVLKLALQRDLPHDIIWRRKFGMSVPMTDWLLGERGRPQHTELRPVLDDLLGPEALKRRGLFQPDYVRHLLAGEDQPVETRRRRVGEKLWALLMLEQWLRCFVDRRGQRP